MNGKPDKINELILNRKADLKEGLGNIIGLFFLLIDWLSFGERATNVKGVEEFWT